MTNEFINITNEQELNLNLNDCKKLQKEIEKLEKKIKETMFIYNQKAFAINMVTDKHRLQEYKL